MIDVSVYIASSTNGTYGCSNEVAFFFRRKSQITAFFSGRDAQVRTVGPKGHSYEAVVVWKYIPPNPIVDLPVRRRVPRTDGRNGITWQSINNSSLISCVRRELIKERRDRLFAFCESRSNYFHYRLRTSRYLMIRKFFTNAKYKWPIVSALSSRAGAYSGFN